MSMLVKLVDSNNAIAIHQLGGVYAHGDDDSNIIKKDMAKAVEFHLAAELDVHQPTAI
jgi:hypothetical protein